MSMGSAAQGLALVVWFLAMGCSRQGGWWVLKGRVDGKELCLSIHVLDSEGPMRCVQVLNPPHHRCRAQRDMEGPSAIAFLLPANGCHTPRASSGLGPVSFCRASEELILRRCAMTFPGRGSRAACQAYFTAELSKPFLEYLPRLSSMGLLSPHK